MRLRDFALLVFGFLLGAFGVLYLRADIDVRRWSRSPGSPIHAMQLRSESGVTYRLLFDSTGTLSSLAHIRDELPDGPVIAFHGNGGIAEIGSYAAGNRHGSWRAMTPDGVVLRDAVFDKGRIVAGSWPEAKHE